MASETDKIFLIQADGEFGEVERTSYESEDLLERLLEHHPGLLAGDMESRLRTLDRTSDGYPTAAGSRST
jgi:hypothetical protein